MTVPVITVNGETLEWSEVAGEYVTQREAEGLSLTARYKPPPPPKPPTYSVAWGRAYSAWGGGWTTLGPGMAFPYPNDVQLEGMSQIAGGAGNTAFVCPDGSLYVCGLNYVGTLGQGYVAIPQKPGLLPTKVTGGVPLYPAEAWTKTFIPGALSVRPDGPLGPIVDGKVIAAAGCGGQMFALLDSGRVVGWGGNAYAPLGNGYYGTELEGIYGGGKQVVEAIHKDEEEGHFKPQYAPGYVLENGPPQEGTPLEAVQAIAVGHGVALYLLDNGDVWFSGWLGGLHGAPEKPEELYARPIPEPARAAVKGAIAITCQHQTCLALMPDGTVKAFGTNALGQFGNGKVKKEEGAGTKVGTVEVVPGEALRGVVAISGGEYHSVFLIDDGHVWCCGRNLRGECGQGILSPPGAAFKRPVLVGGMPNVIAIAAAGEPEFGETTIGSPYTLALLSDGTVMGWGGNSQGQLCDGTTEDKPAPVKCQDLSGVIGIAAASTNGKAIIAGASLVEPSMNTIPPEGNDEKGVRVWWTAQDTKAIGWHVKWRHAQPEPLTPEQEALGWYRVRQEPWKTTKLLPAETREYFVPLEPLSWTGTDANASDPPHYPSTLLEITVAEVQAEGKYPGQFQARTIEVDVGS